MSSSKKIEFEGNLFEDISPDCNIFSGSVLGLYISPFGSRFILFRIHLREIHDGSIRIYGNRHLTDDLHKFIDKIDLFCGHIFLS